jgi:hypothetical protein
MQQYRRNCFLCSLCQATVERDYAIHFKAVFLETHFCILDHTMQCSDVINNRTVFLCSPCRSYMRDVSCNFGVNRK